MGDEKRRTRKPRPPGSGLAVVASFWLWGALLFYAPTYLSATGGWRVFLNVLGGICLAISVAGAGTELGRMFRSEALSYWGVGLLFVLLAVLLHIATLGNRLLVVWTIVARLSVLLLVSVGGSIILYGFSYLFWKSEEVPHGEQIGRVPPETVEDTKGSTIKVVVAVVVVLLNFVTAVLKLLAALRP